MTGPTLTDDGGLDPRGVRVPGSHVIEPHPRLAPAAAIARLEHALAEPDQGRAAARELIMSEVEELVAKVGDEKIFPPTEAFRQETLTARLRRYEDASATLIALMVTSMASREPALDDLWTAALERLADIPPIEGSDEVWRDLRRYPALCLLYAGGIMAVTRSKYQRLAHLFRKPRFDAGMGIRFPIGWRLYPSAVLRGRHAHEHLGISQPAPFSVWIERELQPAISTAIPRPEDYQDAFDQFELHLSLFALPPTEFPRFDGCFRWRTAERGYRDALATMISEIEAQGAEWPPFTTGVLIPSDPMKVVEQLRRAQQAYSKEVSADRAGE